MQRAGCVVVGVAALMISCTAERHPSGAAVDASTPNPDAPPPDAAPGDASVNRAISAQFFGMHAETWPPPIPVGSRRLWDAQTSWFQIDRGPTAHPQYDFSTLDQRIAAATAPVDLYYTFGRTPNWISSGKTLATPCDYVGKLPNGQPDPATFGQCYPPSDVDSSGNGSDAAFSNFVTALVDHVCGSGQPPNMNCSIRYFELWNEPTGDPFWAGNYAQLARMSADAIAIIKRKCQSCVVLTPAVSAGGDGSHANKDSGNYVGWMTGYLDALAARGGAMPDAGAWHPYPGHTSVAPPPFPETNTSSSPMCTPAVATAKVCGDPIVQQIGRIQQVWSAYGITRMFASEGSFGYNSNFPAAADQAAWLARWYILLANHDVERAYWYAYDNATFGRLIPPTGQAATAANAFTQIQQWLVGSQFTDVCGDKQDIWSCSYVDHAGHAHQLVWSVGANASVSTTATAYVDLTGASHAVQDGQVLATESPIRLDL